MGADTRRASVASLRAALAGLRDDDELWVNRVKNLSIMRDGEPIGHIALPHTDLSKSVEAKVDIYDDEDEDAATS